MINENINFSKKADELREYLQTLPNELLIVALDGVIDVNQLMHETLASRGWSAKKKHWVGQIKALAEYADRWGTDPEF